MFGSSKSTDVSKSSNAPTGLGSGVNALVKGTSVEGTVRCESDIRIDGTIKGKLLCSAKVIIGPTGAVEGEIHCQNAVVEGRIRGVMTVKELLNVREAADVDGDISTGKLIVQSGAKFNVACKMDQGASANGNTKNAPNSNDTAKIATAKTTAN